MIIDCRDCVAREVACDDCLVRHIVAVGSPDAPEPRLADRPIEVDAEDYAAMAELVRAGLLPPLRYQLPLAAAS